MINPVQSLNSGTIVYQFEKPNTVAEQIQWLCNPLIKAPSDIIHTESGYTVIIPPQGLGGSKIEVEKLGGGYYLISKTSSIFGAQTEKIIMSEKEFIDAFNGVKTKKDDEKTSEKRFKLKAPYDYFRTKSGYVIKLLNGNNITGASVEVKAQPDGTYLVTTRPYGGGKPEKEILSEWELIKEFHGEKVETSDNIYSQIA